MKETEDDALKLGNEAGPAGLRKYLCWRSTHVQQKASFLWCSEASVTESKIIVAVIFLKRLSGGQEKGEVVWLDGVVQRLNLGVFRSENTFGRYCLYILMKSFCSRSAIGTQTHFCSKRHHCSRRTERAQGPGTHPYPGAALDHRMLRKVILYLSLSFPSF